MKTKLATIPLLLAILTSCAGGGAVLAQTAPASATAPTTAAQLATPTQLATALNAMSEGSARVSGSTVTLTKGTGVTRDLTVPAGVTLDITEDSGLWLRDGRTLTVNGTVNMPSGRIGHDGDTKARSITVNGSGTINLKSKGSLFDVGEGRKHTLDGVTLVGLADNDRPLVRTGRGGELVLLSGSITSNITSHPGAGVYVDQDSTFTMTGGEITGNGNTGVAVGEGAVFTMSGGIIRNADTGIRIYGDTVSAAISISGNAAIEDCHGALLLVESGVVGANVTISGGTLRNSSYTAVDLRGRDNTINVLGGTITNSNADHSCAMILQGSENTFNISGGTITYDSRGSGITLPSSDPSGAIIILGRTGNKLNITGGTINSFANRPYVAIGSGIATVINTGGTFTGAVGAFIVDQTGRANISGMSIAPSPAPQTQSPQSTRYALVNAATLNVRSGPSADYAAVGQVTQNTRVEVLESSGAWWRIRAWSVEGWVNSSYLRGE